MRTCSKCYKRLRSDNKVDLCTLHKRGSEYMSQHRRELREKRHKEILEKEAEYRRSRQDELNCYSRELYNNRKDKVKARRKELRSTWDSTYRKYGLTKAGYDSILSSQGGMCAICGTTDPGRSDAKSLSVDHDHKSGRVRGLLCNRCNIGLGQFKDSPELLQQAIEYLQAPTEATASEPQTCKLPQEPPRTT